MTLRTTGLTLAAAMIVLGSSAPTQAQDGPLRKIGRALDNAGKDVRARVEGEIVRSEIIADERELMDRVQNRVRWDKQLAASVLEIVVRADGSVILRGSVLDQAAKDRAVDLTQSTVGVTKVIDELAVGKEVRVIETGPAKVITTPPTTVVVPGETRVVVPVDAKVVPVVPR